MRRLISLLLVFWFCIFSSYSAASVDQSSQPSARDAVAALMKEIDQAEKSDLSREETIQVQQTSILTHMLNFANQGGKLLAFFTAALPIIIGEESLKNLFAELNNLRMSDVDPVAMLDKANPGNLADLKNMINHINNKTPELMPGSFIEINKCINTILSSEMSNKDHQERLETAKTNLRIHINKGDNEILSLSQKDAIIERIHQQSIDKVQMLHIGVSTVAITLQLNWMKSAISQLENSKILVSGQNEKMANIKKWVLKLAELCNQVAMEAAEMDEVKANSRPEK